MVDQGEGIQQIPEEVAQKADDVASDLLDQPNRPRRHTDYLSPSNISVIKDMTAEYLQDNPTSKVLQDVNIDAETFWKNLSFQYSVWSKTAEGGTHPNMEFLIFEAVREEESQKKIRELEKKLYEDPETKIFKKAYYDEQLHEDVDSLLKAGRQVSVLSLDGDNFKGINDNFGHTVGDFVIESIAKRLHLLTRPQDIVVGRGGDEFLIVLVDVTPEQAQEISTRLTTNDNGEPGFVFSYKPEDLEPGQEQIPIQVPVNLSVGISNSSEGLDARKLDAESDIALYKSKETGQPSRITTYEPGMVRPQVAPGR